MTRRSPYVIKLSAADRAVLEKQSRSYTARHADVIRAKIVCCALTVTRTPRSPHGSACTSTW
jgi:hypothetical protein